MHSVLPSRSPVGSGHPDPFKALPDNRVILVKWDIATTVPSGSSRDAIVRIIIPASVFLDSSHCLLDSTTPIRPVPKQWDEWGPQNTRMFYSDHTPNSDRTTVGLAGPRVIQMSDTHDGECVSVLDFTKNAAVYWKTNAEVVASELNHNGIWWCRAKEARDGHLSYIVPRTLPTIIINPVFAGGRIETSLPYCVSSKVIAQDRRGLGSVRGIRAGDEQFVRFYTPNLVCAGHDKIHSSVMLILISLTQRWNWSFGVWSEGRLVEIVGVQFSLYKCEFTDCHSPALVETGDSSTYFKW